MANFNFLDAEKKTFVWGFYRLKVKGEAASLHLVLW